MNKNDDNVNSGQTFVRDPCFLVRRDSPNECKTSKPECEKARSKVQIISWNYAKKKALK